MKLEEIIKLENEVITLEQLQEIEESECVECVEDNGMSGKIIDKHWYSIVLNVSFINRNCGDSEEIQVYV